MANTHLGGGGDEEFEEPPHLRRLRWMVMVLILVLILGVLSIAATIVIRLGFGGENIGAQAISAAEFELPAYDRIVAVGDGVGTVLFVVESDAKEETVLVYDAKTGELLSSTPLKRR